MDRPMHAWIGRKECGCCMAVATDIADADMFQFLADETKRGLTFERVTWEEYMEVSEEETFMSCKHGQLRLAI